LQSLLLRAYSIVASAGYHIVDVVVDGASKGAVNSYTIGSVKETHTITASFAIDTSETAGESVQELITTIGDWNLPKGTENSLTNKLQNALQSIEKGQQNAAINQLKAFINEAQAQKNKKLTNVQADTLISEAQKIINLIKT
jgi:hypothetical protein